MLWTVLIQAKSRRKWKTGSMKQCTPNLIVRFVGGGLVVLFPEPKMLQRRYWEMGQSEEDWVRDKEPGGYPKWASESGSSRKLITTPIWPAQKRKFRNPKTLFRTREVRVKEGGSEWLHLGKVGFWRRRWITNEEKEEGKNIGQICKSR